VSGSIADKNGIVTCHSQYFGDGDSMRNSVNNDYHLKGWNIYSKLPDALFQEEMIPLVT